MDDSASPPDDASPDDTAPDAVERIVAARLAGLEALREQGIDPYPTDFRRTHLATDLHARYTDLDPGTETDDSVSVAGRVRLQRSFGKLVFLTVDDGSATIQLFIAKDDHSAEAFARIADIDLGDWIGATGTVMTTKKGELSVRPSEVRLLAKALIPFPDKWHGLTDIELRSRRRELDLMVNDEARETALTRSRIVSLIRRMFEDRGYIEVETPILQSQAGGALARPFVTHHNALDIPMYLRIATELHLKRLVVGGLERVFEIGRIFRNEGVDATHNPEFTTLESYEAFADHHDIMRLVEAVFEGVAVDIKGSSTFSYRDRPIDLTAPFRRARMVDLVSEAVGEDCGPDRPLPDLQAVAARHGVDGGSSYGVIIEGLFDELVQPKLWDPVFVLDHPIEISPLARAHPDAPEFAQRFELFIAGSEYANAFTELNDPEEQRRRFDDQATKRAEGDDEAHLVDEDFLRALRQGMPPTGGLGIGIDRLAMLMSDKTHIRDVILFPTMRPEHRPGDQSLP